VRPWVPFQAPQKENKKDRSQNMVFIVEKIIIDTSFGNMIE
jgi:hypothetical protein